MSERLQSVTHTYVNDKGKTRSVTSEYDEAGALIPADAKAKAESIREGDLPADFPGRDVFRRAGLTTIEALRAFRRHGPFTRIEGIDSMTAQAAELLVATTPEKDEEVAEVSAADALSTGLKTQVSKPGSGTEATGASSKLDAPGGKASPVAGHGVEGFIVADKDKPGGTHTTTDLKLAAGATKSSPTSDPEPEAVKAKAPAKKK